MNLYFGTAGWAYDGWKGGFYPSTVKTESYLTHYSKFFNFTEVNTTFYTVPAETTLKAWEDATPEDFRFGIKVWKEITHDLKAPDISEKIEIFFNRMSELEKARHFLFQFPPWFHYSEEHLKLLLELQSLLHLTQKHILEFRHNSWFQPSILQQLQIEGHYSIATSYGTSWKVTYPVEKSQSLAYIRMIGDRKLKKFTHIQREQNDQLDELSTYLSEQQQAPSFEDIFVIFNNHFRGFAPQDIYDIRRRLKIPQRSFTQQKNLLDYLKK